MPRTMFALALGGCLAEFPARSELLGEVGFGDSLTGHAPGHLKDAFEPAPESDVGAGPSSKPPPAVGTGSPEPGQPPTEPPPPPPTEPPPGCDAEICEACDAHGDLVALETDARCPNTDCAGFDIPEARVNPATGGPTCRLLRTAMAHTCAGPGACLEASAVTCLQTGQIRAEVEGTSECEDIAGCAPGQDPRVIHKPAGAPCAAGDGVCDGRGTCQLKTECLQARLGGGETFCPQATGLAGDVCRFRVLPGSWDADPEPGDEDPLIDCDHFCQDHGWSCVRVLENTVDCSLCLLGDAGLCTVFEGCDRTFSHANAGLLTLWDGLLCECRIDGGTQ